MGLVIGKGGETIKMLLEKTGAKVAVVPDAQADPNSLTRVVTINGSDMSIELAKNMINDIVLGRVIADININ